MNQKIIHNPLFEGTGITYDETIDLEAEGPVTSRHYALKSFRHASVTVIAPAGTSGNIPIGQANTAGSTLDPLSPAASIAVVPGQEVTAYDLIVSGRMLKLDLSGLTLPATGKLHIIIVGKRG